MKHIGHRWGAEHDLLFNKQMVVLEHCGVFDEYVLTVRGVVVSLPGEEAEEVSGAVLRDVAARAANRQAPLSEPTRIGSE